MSKPSRIKPAHAPPAPPPEEGPSAAEAATQARATRALARRTRAANAGLAALVDGIRARIAGVQEDTNTGMGDAPGTNARTADAQDVGVLTGRAANAGKPASPDASTSLAALAALLLARPGAAAPALAAPDREALVSALNAAIGDRLARDASPLAIRMALRQAGHVLPLQRDALAAALPHAGERLLMTIHDFGMNDLQWRRETCARPGLQAQAHDHGQGLAEALGFTTLALHYNSGLHVSTNGRALALRLEQLLHEWPRPLARFAILAHGMGGLLARSALHHGRAAGHHWPDRLDDLVFLGTPHHGTDLVSGSRACWLGETPHGAAFATLAGLLSPGFTDLGHGNLLDEDWINGDRLARATDRRLSVPLPVGPRCQAIAGSIAVDPDGAKDGKNPPAHDGFVPLASALGRHRLARRTLKFAPTHLRTFMQTDHLGLLASAEVFAQLRQWMAR